MKTADSREDGQIPKVEDSAANLESDRVKSLKPTTWDEWFDDEEKSRRDFMLSRD
ncbi:Uncharacterised protein [Pseudomonas fluorescens]|uniref:Uncharacterized protein n=1 Tax=Pseudomonas fluorescens TaxID=294 RepID=A0A3S4SMT9_PSEFL|nr:Uncharacterised protein [Pseudomonas fluorescens]